MKKPPSLAVCLDLLGLVRCRVNLPLLHRRWAGIAKVKVAGKENGLAHTGSGCSSDYNNKL
jgi:hypothetical protein